MKITNHTSRTIPLPSGHRLRPGETKGIPKSVRLHSDNQAFLQGEERAGRISFEGSPPKVATKPPAASGGTPAAAWNGEEVTRASLAQMRKADLLAVGKRLGKLTDEDMAGLNVEDGPKGEGLRTVVAAAVLDEL